MGPRATGGGIGFVEHRGRLTGQRLSVGKSSLLQRDERERGADLGGEVLIFDFFADRQCLLVLLACSRQVASDHENVAQPGHRIWLPAAVSDFLRESERLIEVLLGSVGIAHLQRQVPQIIQRGGRAATVAELVEGGQRLLLHLQGAGQIPRAIEGIGDISIVAGEAGWIVNALVKAQGLVVVCFCFLQFSLLVKNISDPLTRGTNAFLSPDLLKNRKRLLNFLPRTFEVALVEENIRGHEQRASRSLSIASRGKELSGLRRELDRLV